VDAALVALAIRDSNFENLSQKYQALVAEALAQADRGEFSDMSFEDIKREGRRRMGIS
jgi:hypothetical protein